jgi:hypothetical protein
MGVCCKQDFHHVLWVGVCRKQTFTMCCG